MSVVADGNLKLICPFKEYVCCYMRDYSENLTANSAIDGPNDLVSNLYIYNLWLEVTYTGVT